MALGCRVSRPWTGTNSLKILLLWTLARALQSIRALLVLNQTYELTERKRNRISERKERITVWYNQEKRGVWWRDRHERDGETERVKWLTLDVIRIWSRGAKWRKREGEGERADRCDVQGFWMLNIAVSPCHLLRHRLAPFYLNKHTLPALSIVLLPF